MFTSSIGRRFLTSIITWVLTKKSVKISWDCQDWKPQWLKDIIIMKFEETSQKAIPTSWQCHEHFKNYYNIDQWNLPLTWHTEAFLVTLNTLDSGLWDSKRLKSCWSFCCCNLHLIRTDFFRDWERHLVYDGQLNKREINQYLTKLALKNFSAEKKPNVTKKQWGTDIPSPVAEPQGNLLANMQMAEAAVYSGFLHFGCII